LIEHNPPIQYQYNNSNSEINQLKEELIKYKNIVEEQKIMIINLKENLNNMNNALKAKDEEIKNLKKTELQKENVITKLNNSIINSNKVKPASIPPRKRKMNFCFKGN
jgi:chromosome segregation ATPase